MADALMEMVDEYALSFLSSCIDATEEQRERAAKKADDDRTRIEALSAARLRVVEAAKEMDPSPPTGLEMATNWVDTDSLKAGDVISHTEDLHLIQIVQDAREVVAHMEVLSKALDALAAVEGGGK